MKKTIPILLIAVISLVSCKQDNTELYNEACKLEEQEEFEAAVGLLTEALELNPRDIECLNNRAWDYYDLGKSDESLADFERMLDLDPQSTGAMYGIAYLKFEDQLLEEALDYFNGIIDIQAGLEVKSNRSKQKHSIKAPLDLVFEFKAMIEDSLGIVSELDSLDVVVVPDSLDIVDEPDSSGL